MLTGFSRIIFAAAGEVAITGTTDVTKPVDNNKAKPSSGIEDLFKDSPSLLQPNVSEKPKKDVKNDIMSLFEKVYIFHNGCLVFLLCINLGCISIVTGKIGNIG